MPELFKAFICYFSVNFEHDFSSCFAVFFYDHLILLFSSIGRMSFAVECACLLDSDIN